MFGRLRRGFTLIELLVVIAIIAIIAGILFPVFSRAKESAKKADCISNLKQIGMAWYLYATDYDDQMCPLEIPENGWTLFVVIPGVFEFNIPNPGPEIYWSHRIDASGVSIEEEGLLFPYMKNASINECKSAGSLIQGLGQSMSYTMNQHLDKPFGEIYTGKNFSEVELPAETIMIADTANPVRDPSTNQFDLRTARRLGIEYDNGRVHGRHNGLGNIVWIDGHVSSKKVDHPSVVSFISTDPTPEIMEKLQLGDILKVPRDSLIGYYAPPFDSSDFFYYYTTKP